MSACTRGRGCPVWVQLLNDKDKYNYKCRRNDKDNDMTRTRIPSLDKDKDRHKKRKESTVCTSGDRMSRQYLAHRGANNAEFTFKASSEWPWPFYMGLSVMAGFRSIMATFRRSVLVFWLFLAVQGIFWQAKVSCSRARKGSIEHGYDAV